MGITSAESDGGQQILDRMSIDEIYIGAEATFADVA